MKKLLSLALVIVPLVVLVGCDKPSFKNANIEHELEFGGVYAHRTIEEFNNLGFTYGDSVDVSFSNGYRLRDIPYYNGYYVDAGQPLLVGYPGYPFIKVTINFGDDLWNIANLEEGMTVSIAMNTRGKYKDIQVASDIHYYDEREKYTSDVEFANFRNIKVGTIKENILYRSASPCDNQHKRASYVDRLMEQEEIQFVLNLADTQEKIESYIAKEDFNSPYFLKLYRRESYFLSFSNGEKVDPIALNMNYTSADFARKIASGLKNMAKSDGPYLVHCLEGKDRTGFVCIVLEALMGASYKEIVDDYMLTYKNYYGIDSKDPRYNIIKNRNVDSMLAFLCGDYDYTKGNLNKYITKYLTEMGEMEESDIDLLINKLK